MLPGALGSLPSSKKARTEEEKQQEEKAARRAAKKAWAEDEEGQDAKAARRAAKKAWTQEDKDEEAKAARRAAKKAWTEEEEMDQIRRGKLSRLEDDQCQEAKSDLPPCKKARTQEEEEKETWRLAAKATIEEDSDQETNTFLRLVAQEYPNQEIDCGKVAEGAVAHVEEKAPGPEELEQDAPMDRRRKIKELVIFHVEDTTMNIMPSTFGNMLKCLSEGGFQVLLGGARASVGIESGRYMFEVRVVDYTNSGEGQHLGPMPWYQLRIGFSIADSVPILGETQDSVGFDLEGNFVYNKVKTAVAQEFSSDDVLACVLNLHEEGPNANTVSLFVDGRRACQPQALPERLKGKPLYPTITFKNLTVHYNFGPLPAVALPFNCHMVQGASARDVVESPSLAPEDGRYDVLFPTCLPDEGTFDWLDLFLENHPQFTELSDRAILNWAELSGVPRPWGRDRSSNDRPEMGSGIPELDDMRVRRFLWNFASIQKRNYIVMEVKSNLLREERMELMSFFPGRCFRKVSVTLMGEPAADFMNRMHELVLNQKQRILDAAFQINLNEHIRRTGLVPMQGTQQGPPIAELTADEKKQFFRKSPYPDLTSIVFSTSFAHFSLPSDDEGFDELRQDWLKGAKCTEYFRHWMRGQKFHTRVEDLEPSEWFHKRHKDWLKLFQAWYAKQNEYRFALAQKAAENARNEANENAAPTAKASVEKAAAKTMLTAEAKKNVSVKNKFAHEGEQHEREKEQTEAADAAKDHGFEGEGSREEDTEKEGVEVNVDLVDPFGQVNLYNIGGALKQPLFSKFGFEDWTMMSLRFELNLLVHSFRHDVADPDRIGFPADHLTFYYGKYFKKLLNPKNYGVDTIKELIELVDDTVKISPKSQIVETHLPAKLESYNIFVMLTEEARRDRQRHLDLGHEDARLRIAQPLTSGVWAGGAATSAGMPTGARPQNSLLGVVPPRPAQMPPVATAGVPLPPGFIAFQQLSRPAAPRGPTLPMGGSTAPGVPSAPAPYRSASTRQTQQRPSHNSWRSDGAH